jgi:hypothetical protein
MSQNKMTGKLIIKAVLEVKTGMHIGASNDYAPIGAVDSVFIRDTLTKEPIIPGSSIKGKMRTLLAKVRDSDNILPAPEKDEAVILRLFGSAEKNNTLFSRLQFSDCMVQKESIEMFNEIDTDTYLGEVKFENTINRGTGVANPRQIERVPAGMTFDFRLVYNIENEEQLDEDMKVLHDGLELLQLDYIGGHGSRGYGRIQFSHFTVEKFALGMEEPESVEVYETLFNGSKL